MTDVPANVKAVLALGILQKNLGDVSGLMVNLRIFADVRIQRAYTFMRNADQT